MKVKFFPIILGLFIYFFSQHAFGQEFFVKKKYRDWNVYSSASNNCFLASKAKRTASYFNSREVLGKNRQNSFIYLSKNKNNNNYSMTYFSDFPLKDNASGTMNIDERKMMSGRMINTVTADNYMNTAKHTLPILERAQYVVQRPGYMNTTTKIQTETNLPDNNRNNISNRTMIMEGDMPSVHGTIQTTASEENSAFARTNSSDSTSYAMKINIEAPETNSGFASIDRINPAYKQNWRRNEMKVEQKFQENEDRSTPCRSPSRNMNTDVRMTSTLQSESKREMCERPVSSQSHRSTPLMRAAISRNEDTY